jgi:hypothetical protein
MKQAFPRCPSRQKPTPYGLWSLWDMHEFRVKVLIDAMDVLVNCSGMIHSRHPKIYPAISTKARADLSRFVERLIPQLAQAELDMCQKGAEKVLKVLQDTNQASQIVIAIDNLRGRLLDQIETTFCLLLSPAEKRIFEATTPFGVEVETKFPSASEDIYEAHKCLALGRSTACVMHLMRVSEVGLKALATALSVGHQTDWGGYIREIEREMDSRAKSSGKRSADELFYSECALAFGHLKRAWRNPSMHVDKTYTPDRAKEILDAISSFMSHLATKLSEVAP